MTHIDSRRSNIYVFTAISEAKGSTFGIDRGQTYGVVHSLMRPAADPAL